MNVSARIRAQPPLEEISTATRGPAPADPECDAARVEPAEDRVLAALTVMFTLILLGLLAVGVSLTLAAFRAPEAVFLLPMHGLS